MDINRSGYYKYLNRQNKPSIVLESRRSNINLFISYHLSFPSHGYRWLNAKIRIDTGVVFSDNYAFKCCHYAGIKSKARHARNKAYKEDKRVFDNILAKLLAPKEPFKLIVSDMTAFKVKGIYYEITFYMDLFNNEIIAYGLVSRRGDNRSYYNGLEDLIQKKKEYNDLELVLHTDQGSVYSSKDYNNLLLLNNIIHSMSRPGTPTDNAAMESINGWVKEELFVDFNIKDVDDVETFIKEYIVFFNEARPAYSLKYLTPKQYKDKYYKKLNIVSTNREKCLLLLD